MSNCSFHMLHCMILGHWMILIRRCYVAQYYSIDTWTAIAIVVIWKRCHPILKWNQIWISNSFEKCSKCKVFSKAYTIASKLTWWKKNASLFCRNTDECNARLKCTMSSMYYTYCQVNGKLENLKNIHTFRFKFKSKRKKTDLNKISITKKKNSSSKVKEYMPLKQTKQTENIDLRNILSKTSHSKVHTTNH